MRKLLTILLSVLCMLMVVSASVSANPSFNDGEFHIIAGKCTVCDEAFTSSGDPTVDDILSNPTSTKLEALNIGVPSAANNTIYLIQKAFDVVNGPCAIGDTSDGYLYFTVEHAKIIPGAKVGVVYYCPSDTTWYYQNANSIDTSAHIASFKLAIDPQVVIVIAVPKGNVNPSSGVVDTATK